jgi:hypothetical protein
MPWQLPVNFSDQAGKSPAKGAKNQPPTVIKASDLMKNFSYAALDADDSLITTETAAGGHQKRKLKIPVVPSGGTFVLGAVDGALKWLTTEEC